MMSPIWRSAMTSETDQGPHDETEAHMDRRAEETVPLRHEQRNRRFDDDLPCPVTKATEANRRRSAELFADLADAHVMTDAWR
ncbi:hypothetical protein CGZ96_04385 [Enemella evansiae]|nr:hypothetical protein CGZ96_04385 [Enemella evansiae]